MSEKEKTRNDLKKIIESLLECEVMGKNCRKCRLRRNGCLLFVRDSVAVALQFIESSLNDCIDCDDRERIYS